MSLLMPRLRSLSYAELRGRDRAVTLPSTRAYSGRRRFLPVASLPESAAQAPRGRRREFLSTRSECPRVAPRRALLQAALRLPRPLRRKPEHLLPVPAATQSFPV